MKDTLNRRTFLRSTAVTGAGLAIAPSIFSAPAKEKPDDINVAIIGVGEQGMVLRNSYHKLAGINIKAVCDIWKYKRDFAVDTFAKFAVRYPKKYSAKGYEDYKEMLDKEKDLDVAIIATPDFYHEPHTVACLEAGLHVYCEKEMSNTIKGARNMVLAQRKSKKLLQIGHQRRSNPKYIYCKDNVLDRDNLVGRITAVNGQWNRTMRPDLIAPPKYAMPPAILKKYGYKNMHQFMNWRWYKGMGGGPIVDLGSHQIDVYNWFLDATPVSVTASGGTDYYAKATHEWYDTVMAIFEYKTKQGMVRAFYQNLTTNSSNGYSETFMGIDGTLNISEADKRGGVYPERYADKKVVDKWKQYVLDKKVLAPPEEEEKDEKEEELKDVRSVKSPTPPKHGIPVEMNEKAHAPHLKNFFAAIRGKEKLNCPADEAFACAVSVHKVNEAIEARKTLTFDPKEFKV